MPDLNFQVEKAEPIAHAVSPTIGFSLRVNDAQSPRQIHSVALRAQIQIDPTRRQYTPGEQERLTDLFGEPSRWGQTLRSMLWTHAYVNIPPFTGTAIVEMPVACTFDFNVATTKYFHSLENGEIPLRFLFSGTIFHEGDHAPLQVAQISWEKEATFRLNVRTWAQMMEMYYPNTAWLCLRQDVFDRVHAFKIRRGLPTWEAAMDKLLAGHAEETPR